MAGTRKIFLLLAGYFALHLLFRVLLSNGVELDEAEQLLWAQDFRMGYGPELPLYTWLQAGSFAVFGVNVFALVLVKNLLLFLAYLFTFLGAEEVTGDEKSAFAAGLTLFFIPQIVWESQRVLTHMVLATTLVSATLYFFLKIARTGKFRYYLLAGFSAGLGMLSKYNFGIFLLALLIAAVSIRPLRPSLLNRKTVASAAVFLLVTFFPFAWLAAHTDLALAKTAKLHMGEGGGRLAGYVTGIRQLAVSSVSYCALPVVLYGLLFNRAPDTADCSRRSGDNVQLVGRTLLFALMLSVLLILFFRVTQFRVRWMQPLLFPLPILLAALVCRKLSEDKLRRIRMLAASAAVFVVLVLPGRVLLASHFRPTSQNEPYGALAAQMTGSGFSSGLIIAESQYLGGNLKLQFPTSRITAPDLPAMEPLAIPPHSPVVVVWNAVGNTGMPARLDGFVRNLRPPVSPAGKPHFVEAPYTYAAGHTMRLGFMVIDPGPI